MDRTQVLVVTAFLSLLFSGCASSGGNSGKEKAETETTYILVAANRDGDILTIDDATGAATLRLDTSTEGATDVGVVSAMLYKAADDVLWLGTGGFSGAPECDACIRVLGSV